MCDKAFDHSIAALKFVPDWLVTSKIFENFHDSLVPNNDILFFYEDFSKVFFYGNGMCILGAVFDKINLDDDSNFYEDNRDTIIHAKLLAWHNKFEKAKKIDEPLMPVAWHPARWWNWCDPDDEKKGATDAVDGW